MSPIHRIIIGTLLTAMLSAAMTSCRTGSASADKPQRFSRHYIVTSDAITADGHMLTGQTLILTGDSIPTDSVMTFSAMYGPVRITGVSDDRGRTYVPGMVSEAVVDSVNQAISGRWFTALTDRWMTLDDQPLTGAAGTKMMVAAVLRGKAPRQLRALCFYNDPDRATRLNSMLWGPVIDAVGPGTTPCYILFDAGPGADPAYTLPHILREL